MQVDALGLGVQLANLALNSYGEIWGKVYTWNLSLCPLATLDSYGQILLWICACRCQHKFNTRVDADTKCLQISGMIQ